MTTIAGRFKILLLFALIFAFIPSQSLYSRNARTSIDSLLSMLGRSEGVDRAMIMDTLSREYSLSDYAKSLEYALKMYHLSLELGNIPLQQKAVRNCAWSYFDLSKYDSVLFYAEKIPPLVKKHKNDRMMASYYLLLSELDYNSGDNTAGIKHCKGALNLYEKLGDSNRMARVFSDLSHFYVDKGEFDSAMYYAINALKSREKLGDTLRIVASIGALSNIYISMKDENSAKNCFFRMKDLMQNHPNTHTYFQILGAIAGVYNNMNMADSALYFYKISLSAVRKSGNQLALAKTLTNIGECYINQGDYQQAIHSFREAKSIYAKVDAPKYCCFINLSFGHIYLATNSLDSSEIYLKKALECSFSIDYVSVYERALKTLYGLYETKGDFHSALTYYKKYNTYYDSIRSADIQLRLAELETKYETEKKEQEILKMKHEQEIHKTRETALTAGIAGIIIIFLLIIIGIWQKRRKDKLIHKQKELMYVQEQKLADAALEKSKLKEEELQQTLVYKSRQLSSHALHMMQKNSLLQEIQEELKGLSEHAEEKGDVKRINFLLNQSLRSDKDWDVFKLYFDEINPNFFNQLKDINPELTSNDLRLSALIQLNMNSKEMASVLNISPNSIKSARYRLKKKLALDAEADLEHFIRNLV